MSKLQEFLDYELSDLINKNDSDDNFLSFIGQKLKKARCEKNISQSELEKKTGISQSNICKMENGKVNFSIIQLKKYADGIGVELLLEVK